MSGAPDNELFGIVYAVTDKPDWAVSEVHDAILAAGYRKPRTVTTVEEVNALPTGAIILDSDPDALLKIEGGQWRSLIGPDEPFKSLYLPLPATVLHEPAE